MNIFGSELLPGASGESETATAEVESISYVADIKDMMHGFGDSSKPLLESAQLIEEIIHQQLVSTYHRALEVSEMRGSRNVRVEDIIFLLRNNKSKMQRILKFVALKEIKKNVSTSMDNGTAPVVDSRALFGRCNPLINYLLSIDQTGEIEDLLFSAGFESAWTGRAGVRDGSTVKDASTTTPLFSPVVHIDTVKYDRSVRADEMTQLMDQSAYFNFFEARRVCFASARNGGTARFWEWISSPRGKAPLKRKKKAEKDAGGILGNGEICTEEEPPIKGHWPQPTIMALEVMSYLAFEAVAQLIDFALLVRRDGVRSQEDRLMPPLYYNPSFPMHQEPFSAHKFGSRYQPYHRRTYVGAVPRSSADTLVRSRQPITPAEIQEAIRRFWSPSSIGPLSHFDREPAPSATRRLLCC